MNNFFYITASIFFCGGTGALFGIAMSLSKIEQHLSKLAENAPSDE
ncbi:hypothetical protein [Rhodopirellula sallentina]|uniref:Membrane or secreted protein n=1 Tax=Rhodopirellula sallentina SM41 TaxID=1263870 RepID=M5U2F7_9BACT|nr:hypothetical protein [Rhodopirellula sallentina]EMI55642.1 membrane or secreted protein [Rhodopirellula sallentina SM41]